MSSEKQCEHPGPHAPHPYKEHPSEEPDRWVCPGVPAQKVEEAAQDETDVDERERLRVEVSESPGSHPTCKVWRDGVVVFDGVSRAALAPRTPDAHLAAYADEARDWAALTEASAAEAFVTGERTDAYLAAAKAEALEEAAEELVRTGPGINAELRYDGTPDPGISGYVEGLHDAWNLLRARAARLREQGGE